MWSVPGIAHAPQETINVYGFVYGFGVAFMVFWGARLWFFWGGVYGFLGVRLWFWGRRLWFFGGAFMVLGGGGGYGPAVAFILAGKVFLALWAKRLWF